MLITATGVELSIHATDGTDATTEITANVQVSYTVCILSHLKWLSCFWSPSCISFWLLLVLCMQYCKYCCDCLFIKIYRCSVVSE